LRGGSQCSMSLQIHWAQTIKQILFLDAMVTKVYPYRVFVFFLDGPPNSVLAWGVFAASRNHSTVKIAKVLFDIFRLEWFLYSSSSTFTWAVEQQLPHICGVIEVQQSMATSIVYGLSLATPSDRNCNRFRWNLLVAKLACSLVSGSLTSHCGDFTLFSIDNSGLRLVGSSACYFDTLNDHYQSGSSIVSERTVHLL
jgi:hypothetical protein